MSSGKGDLSRLYKSTDGCQTWKLIFTNPDKDGFWDALIMTSRNIGMLIGDPISEGHEVERFTIQQRLPVFPTYHTVDGGMTWSRNDHGILYARADEKRKPEESIFAASNSSMLLVPYAMVFVTGGEWNGLHYSQQFNGPVPLLCKGPCFVGGEAKSTLASGETAGGFSLAANVTWTDSSVPPESRVIVAVGGDFKLSDATSGTAATCPLEMEGIFMRFQCEPAATPPHGYRSSVAYDAATKTWITVGPNGTDVSSDDGRNWHALHPDPALHEPADADRNWNALSLPFVVGPHGRIGKLNAQALDGAKGGK